MLDLKKSQPQLALSDCWKDNYQCHRGMFQVQREQLKLKEEKQRDKSVYQSIKDKIAAR